MTLGRKILMSVVIFCLLAGAGAGLGAYYVLRTTEGLRWITWKVIDHFAPAQIKAIGTIAGNLSATAVFKNVELRNLTRLPPGSYVLIQELSVTPHGWDYRQADLTITNARLKLPVSENIVVDGKTKDGSIDMKIFSPTLDAEELVNLIPDPPLFLKSVKGTLKKLDAVISGPVRKAAVKGKVLVEKLTRPDLLLEQSPVTADLLFEGRGRDLKLNGGITVEKGSVTARRTKIELKPSKIYFSGNPKNPSLAIDAYSRVDTVDIDILVSGKVKDPQLKVTSDPPLSRDELLVTLATGRRWEGFEQLEEGKISSDLVKQLAGYLFAGESGDGFLDRLGIRDVHVTVEDNKKSVGFKKEVSDNLDLGYEVEQQGAPTTSQGLSQTVGADYRVTNSFFATVEHQLPIQDGVQAGGGEVVDDRLMMKYKTRF